MVNPVLLDCGHSISKEAEALLKIKVCPLDNIEYETPLDNYHLKALVAALSNYTSEPEYYSYSIPSTKYLSEKEAIIIQKLKEERDQPISVYDALVEQLPYTLCIRHMRSDIHKKDRNYHAALEDLNFCIHHLNPSSVEYFKCALSRTDILIKKGLEALAKEAL